MKQKQAGFTLVEIAIVLVIIGLLLGGVLKGQELITQAKIKNVLNDLNAVSAGIYGYQDRYKRLPGDDTAASSRWTGAYNGYSPADGIIGGLFDATPATASATSATSGESTIFWRHLRLAGFISGDTTSTEQPTNAVGGITGIQSGALGFAGHALCTNKLPGKVAAAVDAQTDDGKPYTGTVRAIASVSGTADGTTATKTATEMTTLAGGTNVYSEDAATLYVLCKQI